MSEAIKRAMRFQFFPFHTHNWVERFGGLYADEPGGPKTYHEVWLECQCGKVLGRESKERAASADAQTKLFAQPPSPRPGRA